ncbi:hypothetical protein AC578_6577 [Pseudocercospora eumusae]|uniref:Uncharacterized protein n=1 Tax=Pseudocercospora eumusae TaxID=321146 RepID=A0A139HHT3_9PEZI|nr:hypothetical protein AC578_6577 [Pseudocercospora eumusae]
MQSSQRLNPTKDLQGNPTVSHPFNNQPSIKMQFKYIVGAITTSAGPGTFASHAPNEMLEMKQKIEDMKKHGKRRNKRDSVDICLGFGVGVGIGGGGIGLGLGVDIGAQIG